MSAAPHDNQRAHSLDSNPGRRADAADVGLPAQLTSRTGRVILWSRRIAYASAHALHVASTKRQKNFPGSHIRPDKESRPSVASPGAKICCVKRSRLRRESTDVLNNDRANSIRWKAENKADVSAYNLGYRRTIRGKAARCASQRKRDASKLRRTPNWANLDAISAIYAEAASLTASSGVQYHVDHEIPLQGNLSVGCTLRPT